MGYIPDTLGPFRVTLDAYLTSWCPMGPNGILISPEGAPCDPMGYLSDPMEGTMVPHRVFILSCPITPHWHPMGTHGAP